MVDAISDHVRALRRRAPTLFLLAGALLVVYAAMNGLWAFAGMATRSSGFQVGYVLGFLGLLGLYADVARRSPGLARAGAGGAVAGIVGIAAISAFEVGRLVGLGAGTPPGWSVVVVLALAGFVVGYLAFGVAVLKSDAYPTHVGLLLLVPGTIVVLMVAHIAAGVASDATAFVISAGEAMAHLAIGATLRSESSTVDRATQKRRTEAEPTADD